MFGPTTALLAIFFIVDHPIDAIVFFLILDKPLDLSQQFLLFFLQLLPVFLQLLLFIMQILRMILTILDATPMLLRNLLLDFLQIVAQMGLFVCHGHLVLETFVVEPGYQLLGKIEIDLVLFLVNSIRIVLSISFLKNEIRRCLEFIIFDNR